MSAFYPDASVRSLVRLCFAKADATLDAALDRMRGVPAGGRREGRPDAVPCGDPVAGATSLGRMASRRIPTMDFTQAPQAGRFSRAETFRRRGALRRAGRPSCRRISAARRASPGWRRWRT